jgi:hypothetical protein
MNLKLLTGLLALFLTACGSLSARGDLPASDLVALRTVISADLQQRNLPNGRQYCGELARTERAQDECIGDLEDALYASNMDKQRARETLERSLLMMEYARTPCRWFQLRCKSDRRKALDETSPK